MFKTVNFNIYEENLEKVVYGEEQKQEEFRQKEESSDKPIPKPPPQYWNDPMSYRRYNRESEGTGNIL